MRVFFLSIVFIFGTHSYASSSIIEFLCDEDFTFSSKDLENFFNSFQEQINSQVRLDNALKMGPNAYEVMERIQRRQSQDCDIFQRRLSEGLNRECQLADIERVCTQGKITVHNLLEADLDYDNQKSAFCSMHKLHDEANKNLRSATINYKACLDMFEGQALNNPNCRAVYPEAMRSLADEIVMNCSPESLNMAYKGFKTWIEGEDSPVKQFCRSVEAYRDMRLKTIDYGVKVARLRQDIDSIKEVLFPGQLRKPASFCEQSKANDRDSDSEPES